MMGPRFIRVHNKVVNVDSVAYVDFLESGRAMLMVRGVTPEKQNIPVDADEARRIRSFFEGECDGSSSKVMKSTGTK